MRDHIITDAWAKNGWHGYRKGGSETAVPGNSRNLQQRLNRRASTHLYKPTRAQGLRACMCGDQLKAWMHLLLSVELQDISC